MEYFATICRILKRIGLCYKVDSSLSSGVLRMDIYSSGGLLLGINECPSGERYLFLDPKAIPTFL